MRRHLAVRALISAVLIWALVPDAPDTASANDPLFERMGVLHQAKPAPAPEFSLATPDGKTVALAQLRGKLVFLNFWATWCPLCRVEMPAMERLRTEFKDRGLAVIAVDIEESPKTVARFMKELRLSFPSLLDDDAKISALYGVRELPTTFLIDRSGRIVGTASGHRNWASPGGRALIRALLELRG